MHFIITGGAGFIGSHLSQLLLKQGHLVTVVDNLSTGRLSNLPNSSNLRLLTKDVALCCAEDFIQPVDGLVHLAANASVINSWNIPKATHENNLSNVVKIIELSRELQIPRIVFASSAAVYGTGDTLPISENQVCHPISPYGLQKLSAEHYLELFATQIGFSAVSLRLFNVYGPRQLVNSEYAGVISKFLVSLRHNQPLTVFGDGNQTRDFIYVGDVSRAFAKALGASISRGKAVSCNIGTGHSISIKQLLHVLRTLMPESSSKILYAQARNGDIQHSCSNINLARNLIGFEPFYTIHEGLKMFVNNYEIENFLNPTNMTNAIH